MVELSQEVRSLIKQRNVHLISQIDRRLVSCRNFDARMAVNLQTRDALLHLLKDSPVSVLQAVRREEDFDSGSRFCQAEVDDKHEHHN